MIPRQCQKLQIPEKSWGRSESQGSSNLEQKVKPGRTCGSWGLLRSHRVLNMYICSPPPKTAECFSEGHFAVKFQGSSEKSWALSSGLCCFDLQNYLSVALANLGIWQRLLGPSRWLKSEEWFLLISTKDLSGPKDSAGLKPPHTFEASLLLQIAAFGGWPSSSTFLILHWHDWLRELAHVGRVAARERSQTLDNHA